MDSIIQDLLVATKSYNEPNLFSSKEDKLRVISEKCEELLKLQGYTISKPAELFFTHVTTLQDLVDLYYNYLNKYYDSEVKFVSDEQRDFRVVKNFVNKRMKASGLSRSRALRECASIIRTIFSNLNKFKFRGAPGIEILHLKAFGWVIDVAVDIMNDKYKHIREEEYQRKLDKANEIPDDAPSEIEILMSM